MTVQKALITIICPKCNGVGKFLYTRNNKHYLQRCKTCRGAQHVRRTISLPEVKKTHKIRVAKQSIKYVRRNARERVERFRKTNPDRWNEIQRKYRASKRFKDYFREYLIEYRAKKRVEYPKEKVKVGREKSVKDKMCIKCGKFLQRPWGKGLCIWCIADMRKKSLTRGEKMKKKDVKKLRDKKNMTFADIGRHFGVTRQRAYQMYQEISSH